MSINRYDPPPNYGCRMSSHGVFVLYTDHKAEVARLRAELDRYKEDLHAAAGDLPVPIPEPGTDMARLLTANVLMRKDIAQRDACNMCGGSGVVPDPEGGTPYICPLRGCSETRTEGARSHIIKIPPHPEAPKPGPLCTKCHDSGIIAGPGEYTTEPCPECRTITGEYKPPRPPCDRETTVSPPQQQAEPPDKGCSTLPDGDCVGGPCMHTEMPAAHEPKAVPPEDGYYVDRNRWRELNDEVLALREANEAYASEERARCVGMLSRDEWEATPEVQRLRAIEAAATEYVRRLDETPAAYKDIAAVMVAQSDLVEIVHTLKQVVCVKG